jgi:lactoylglutathione lyase
VTVIGVTDRTVPGDGRSVRGVESADGLMVRPYTYSRAMTSAQPSGPPSVLTHLALPVRDLDATLAFFAKYTSLVNIHERSDGDTGLRTVWLANERDITPDGARFVIVLICGSLPTKITGDIEEHYGFLTSIAHLGISVDSRDEVDRIAAMAKEDGCLLLGPMYRNEVVGYICIVTDPDGNNVEFSVEQVLG